MILRISEELFRSKGIRTVSLEEVAEKVGISRGTIYNHFSNKQMLLKSILDPFFIKLETEFEEIEKEQELAFEDMTDFLYRLWVQHRKLWELVHHPDISEYKDLVANHQNFIVRFGGLVRKFPSELHLNGNPDLTAKVVLSIFRPLLNALDGQEKQKHIFNQSLRALLLIGTQ